MAALKITLKRSSIGTRPKQMGDGQGPGLTKLQKALFIRIIPNQGMIAKINHLVES